MFTARALRSSEAHMAFPLVSCRYPAITLEKWTSYVRQAESAEGADRLVCLVDRRDRHHAIFSYGVSDAPKAIKRMRVAHIATFQLIGDAIHLALHDALDRLAQTHGCREVIVEPWTPLGASGAPLVRSFAPARAGRVLTLDGALSATGGLH